MHIINLFFCILYKENNESINPVIVLLKVDTSIGVDARSHVRITTISVNLIIKHYDQTFPQSYEQWKVPLNHTSQLTFTKEMPCGVQPLYLQEPRNIIRENILCSMCFLSRPHLCCNLETQGVSYQCGVHILKGIFSKISDTNNGG